jgi:hypothetical protein
VSACALARKALGGYACPHPSPRLAHYCRIAKRLRRGYGLLRASCRLAHHRRGRVRVCVKRLRRGYGALCAARCRWSANSTHRVAWQVARVAPAANGILSDVVRNSWRASAAPAAATALSSDGAGRTAADTGRKICTLHCPPSVRATPANNHGTPTQVTGCMQESNGPGTRPMAPILPQVYGNAFERLKRWSLTSYVLSFAAA